MSLAAGSRAVITVCLAFDLSGSMSGQPLREAQKAAHAFVSRVDLATLGGREGGRYGVVLTDGIWDSQSLAIQRARRCTGAAEGTGAAAPRARGAQDR